MNAAMTWIVRAVVAGALERRALSLRTTAAATDCVRASVEALTLRGFAWDDGPKEARAEARRLHRCALAIAETNR